MAIDSDTASAHATALDLVARMGEFLADLRAIPEVHTIGINSDPVELWVLLEHADSSVSKRILGEHWRRFERSPGPALAIHVVDLDHVRREHLPRFRTISER